MSRKPERQVDIDGRYARDGVMSAVVRTDLSPKAQRILVAAQRVLGRDGYEGFTLSRVAEEALETKSLVLYHFGSRANLEALLIDSLWHDIDTKFVSSLGSLPPETDVRVDALVGFHEQIAGDQRLYRIYFDLLPSVIGNRSVRLNVARIYDAYREDINVRCLQDTALPEAEIRPLSSLFLAVGEGLPLQVLMSPPDFDSNAVFGLFAELAKTRACQSAASRRPETNSAEPGADPAPRRVAADPGRSLPEPARKILKTSRRLLETKGLRSLTLDAIADDSGQSRSSVSYYFRSKQGLIDALYATVLYRYQRAHERLFSDSGGGTGWFPAAPSIQRQLFGRSSPSRAFFLMLPAVLHDGELRRRAGDLYQSLRRLLAEQMAQTMPTEAAADLEPLASMAIATLDGLAIQTLYDPVGFDPSEPLEVLGTLILAGMDRAAARG